MDELETASVASSTRSTRSKASRVSKADHSEKKISPAAGQLKNLTAIEEIDEDNDEEQGKFHFFYTPKISSNLFFFIGGTPKTSKTLRRKNQ